VDAQARIEVLGGAGCGQPQPQWLIVDDDLLLA
jgi:hypothetical protein